MSGITWFRLRRLEPIGVIVVGDDEGSLLLFLQVMTKPKNALIKQYKFQFGIDDVEFHMTEAAMRAVAATAIKKATGARGLRSIMETLLLEVSKRGFEDVASQKCCSPDRIFARACFVLVYCLIFLFGSIVLNGFSASLVSVFCDLL